MKQIVTINAGSSSLKLDLFESGDEPKRLQYATIGNIGQPTAHLVVSPDSAAAKPQSIDAPDHLTAAHLLADWLKQQFAPDDVAAIGHRVVHGGPKYYKGQVIDAAVLTDLRQLSRFDPEHLPAELQLIEIFQQLFPSAMHVACFDTAFHHNLPTPARLLAIPRKYEAAGLRRYGFHGLSYAHLLHELERLEGPEVANGRIILAHLGSGVSLAAVQGGKSIDTTMGLTPASGVPMSTRSGDIDPGLELYLAHNDKLNADQFNQMVNFKSGLLGISETSADMEQLLERENEDSRAKDAVEVFCYQIKKSIGGLAAALGGLDRLVFTGGMGEHAPKIRARVCQGLEFLGIELAESLNNAGKEIISAASSRIVVRVIPAAESQTIAREVAEVLKAASSQ